MLSIIFQNIFIAITREAKDDNLEQELSLADKRNKREIRLLEGEIPLWQVIVEKLNAASKIIFHVLLTLSFPRVLRSKLRKKSRISVCKIVKNKQYHMKVQRNSFHLNGRTQSL